jgi:hypothetical protein
MLQGDAQPEADQGSQSGAQRGGDDRLDVQWTTTRGLLVSRRYAQPASAVQDLRPHLTGEIRVSRRTHPRPAGRSFGTVESRALPLASRLGPWRGAV